MFDTVKTVRLDSYGGEVSEFHKDADIAAVVAEVESQYPGSLIEARYTR